MEKMRNHLKSIQILSYESNNPFICMELEEFREAERSLKAFEDVPEGYLSDLHDTLQIHLGQVLINQKLLAEKEDEGLCKEYGIFENLTESLSRSIEKTDEPMRIETLKNELTSEVLDFSSEIAPIESNFKDSLFIAQTIAKVIEDHPEWTKLKEDCDAVQKIQSLTVDTFRKAHEKIDNLCMTVGIALSENMDLGEEGIFPFEDDDFDTFRFESESENEPPKGESIMHLFSKVEAVKKAIGKDTKLHFVKNTEDKKEAEKEEEPRLQYIKYEPIFSPESNVSSMARIDTRFINIHVMDVAEEMARAGFKVLVVQDDEEFEDHFAELETGFHAAADATASVIRMAPLKLFGHPELWDRHALNEDKKIIVNLRGHQAMRDRMFLPFQVAADKDYDTIIVDCNFGSQHPYLNNPQNLAYTYMAATASYSSSHLCQFLVAGNLNSEFCQTIMSTMGFDLEN